MKGNGGQKTRQPIPSITLLNEQRAATEHGLILINGDVWHSGGGQQINTGAINLVLSTLFTPKKEKKTKQERFTPHSIMPA